MSLLTMFGFTSTPKAKVGRPSKKVETRGRPSKAANLDKEEPLRHVPRKQQQQAKVKKGRNTWSEPKNQERLKAAIKEWEDQEEKVRMNMSRLLLPLPTLTNPPPYPPTGGRRFQDHYVFQRLRGGRWH